MNKIYFFVFSCVLVFSIDGRAQSDVTPIWKTKARALVEKHLGDDLAVRFFGEKEIVYELPAIPEVDSDAKSTDVYDKKYVEKIKLKDDLKLKLNIAYISELYEVIKERKGVGSEVGSWINVMDQGGSREGVYRALVLDRDYQGMENFDRPISSAGAKFAHEFSNRFAAMEINKDTLEQVNFYSVKRLVSEKALEIIDSFEGEKDLFKWYAIMSMELARDYKYAFKNEVRQNAEFDYHINWAGQVPRQHMKSEVIMKLHLVFNTLQKVE
jgi:hypothetical protein